MSAGNSSGLRLGTGQSVVAGLAIHDFSSNGILVMGDNDTIRDNYIGLTPVQTPGPNGVHGISIEPGADNTVIGGIESPHANVIAYNVADGVCFPGSSNAISAGNTIRGNVIHSNTGLGIDFNNNGVTLNDAQDIDGGSNRRQNYPFLAYAYAPANVVEGSLNSTSNGDYVIDFYANTVCDARGHGEGERFLGSASVTTGPDGNVDFVINLAGTFSVGEELAATATDASGSTSEFSHCVTVESGSTGVPEDPILPRRLALFQNAPNPFNPTTAIRYDVPAGGAHLQIAVFDVRGRHVRTLVNGFVTAGRERVTWDGRDARGQAVATGVYFARMQAVGFIETRKMVLLK
jgi:hypothetical protein